MSHSDRTLVIKNHWLENKHVAGKFLSVVYIVRNPYDAYVAEFNRLHSAGRTHIGHATEKQFADGKVIMLTILK